MLGEKRSRPNDLHLMIGFMQYIGANCMQSCTFKNIISMGNTCARRWRIRENVSVFQVTSHSNTSKERRLRTPTFANDSWRWTGQWHPLTRRWGHVTPYRPRLWRHRIVTLLNIWNENQACAWSRVYMVCARGSVKLWPIADWQNIPLRLSWMKTWWSPGGSTYYRVASSSVFIVDCRLYNKWRPYLLWTSL